jgi:isoleucyl-tRNA synthetase
VVRRHGSGREGGRGPGRTRCASKALAAVEATTFYPDWGKARLHAMIANRPDWCISRQRNWGVPIPFFLHKETGELHPRTLELMEAVALRIEKEGIDAWFKLDPAELLGDEAGRLRQDARHARCLVRFRHHARTVLRGSHATAST